ncbi:MAG: ACP S-malonyltransferase [Bacteroidales bacterium]|nr:ACP S-malonyltransferase [Bacteroidales bacterium]
MKRAVVFPGQGAQYVGMGKYLYENFPIAKKRFEQANEILGFRICDYMFNGTEEDLQMTKVTQPAIFLHSVIAYEVLNSHQHFHMTAGHSLGEYSALVASQALSFEDALRLVSQRAIAMQKACELEPSTMAVILGLDDEKVIEICQQSSELVIPANFNCPNQIVISGTVKGVENAMEQLKTAGARRVMMLKVSGAFHSPLMQSAQEELATAIEQTHFNAPQMPIYQNSTAQPSSDPIAIKQHLIEQLTSPVLWTQQVRQMIADGASQFIEFGPGKVLQGLIRKIDSNVELTTINGEPEE